VGTTGQPGDAPSFVARSELLGRAYSFARDAHEGSRSRRGTVIAHPVAVARLVRPHAGDELVAVALLHDVLEDTTVTQQELEDEFGSRIAELVAGLSEDEGIEDYAQRKSLLRAQVAAAGEGAALVFLADKLARMNALGEDAVERIEPAKLEHYRATLAKLSGVYSDLPFVAELRHALRNAPRS
jgi:guanosine-3',5'-bis(diphosphate) 3'-pyrophosphohydrolase